MTTLAATTNKISPLGDLSPVLFITSEVCHRKHLAGKLSVAGPIAALVRALRRPFRCQVPIGTFRALVRPKTLPFLDAEIHGSLSSLPLRGICSLSTLAYHKPTPRIELGTLTYQVRMIPLTPCRHKTGCDQLPRQVCTVVLLAEGIAELLIRIRGFEPPTSPVRGERATRLRHILLCVDRDG